MTTDLPAPQLVIPGAVSAVGLQLPDGLSFAEWSEIVAKLGIVTRASLWWWGDALCYGERKWGEKYAEALAESDYEYQTLATAKMLAAKFQFFRRLKNLPWGHHLEVAALPPDDADRLLQWAAFNDDGSLRMDEKTGKPRPLSQQELRRAVRRERRIAEPGPLPADKYRVIYADPPWSYGDKLVEGYGPAEHHYETMTIEQLCAMDVASRAADDAVLFLWVTSPLLEECFAVVSAWGFEYKASFVWDKIKHNMGHYNSVRHEFLLICTRGSCTPDVSTLIDSVQVIERSDRHSEKPARFREIVDTLYPSGRRIELFSREAVPGWESWGNEAAA